MEIKLHQVLPNPLQEIANIRASAIWRQELLFSSGAFIHIKAPSGTGKSTLIHLLYGLRKDYGGTIFFGDQDILTANPENWATWRQKHLSIVFQDLRLFPQFTITENIEIKRQLTNFYPSDRIHEFAGRLGIADKLHQAGQVLSYGEKQRAAIVRALMQPFEWLLLDEPFSHLDRANIRQAVDLIRQECKIRKAGLILVDLEEDNWFDYSIQLNL